MNRSLLRDLDARSSEELLARLLAIADDAVIATNADQRVVLFNAGAERVFGLRVDAVLGQPLELLLPEAARAQHAQLMRDFASSARVARRMAERREVQGRRADGSLFDAEASIAHLELDGRLFYTVILRDVSENRRAQRQLADSEMRFRNLAAAAPVGIFQTDPEGRCLYVNERWCQIAGMSEHEATGSGWLRALHPADRAMVHRAWQDSLNGDQAFKLSYRFLRPDGSETWVMGNAVLNRDAMGAPLGHIGTVTDVTESHQQSLALERARSEAEAAARAKSVFLANMSHEIRTPLNAVVGMTTLLLDTPLSEDQRDFARTIRSSSENLLEIINDILDYSKADVGKLEIEQQPFDLRRCIEDALDQVTPRAQEKGLNLAYLIEEGTPETLLGDTTRLRQVLVNLLSNAVKFTHHGEVLVRVEADLAEAQTAQLRLQVQDTGIGIAADQLPRLFQSFTQVDASTTRKYGGTGLGLAISQKLADLMGGRVTAQSEVGQGSVFTLHLQLPLAPLGPPAEFLQRDAPALVGKRVLLVDDNLTNRRIVTRLALLWGMQPSTCSSALEALDRVRHGEDFDLAVLDMSMPGMDGLDLAIEIRRHRSAQALPIVMLTSLGQRETLRAGRGAELGACLSKPIKASQLFNTWVAMLKGHHPAPDAAPPAPRARRKPRWPLRVLVAEDNEVNQRVTQRLLQHLGYAPDLAADGQQVLQAVARRPYDVILMDIQMPEIDGVQAARQIVQQRGQDGLPRIIAMTANAMPGDREAYVDAGMDGYLPKPIELARLAQVLEQMALVARDQAAASGEGALDPTRLEHLGTLQDQSQPSLVCELIDLFLNDSAGHVLRIVQAHAAGDAPSLRALAHRFLSATQNIGAVELSRLCAEIEGLSKAGRLADVAPLLPELQRERERAQVALRTQRLRY